MSNGASAEPDPLIGVVIAEAIELEAAVGEGKTGRVYRAKQLGLDRYVAVKVLHPFLMQTAGVKERFHREARLMARLNHPGIVRVLASGELPYRELNQGGETYLVYEYLKGETLRAHLRSVGRMTLVEAMSTLAAIAEAIAEAHDRSIIHRDLKPENVMSVARDNDEQRFVVLDFGLARALDAEGEQLTREGALLGTPQYMSPEAACGEPATFASDVYALATMLYEFIAGQPPFPDGSAIAILAHQANTPAPRLCPTRCIPASVERFILKNLEKSPSLRCENAGRFLEELLQASRESQLALGNSNPGGTAPFPFP
jgi:serine/threonine-protein kinase